MTEEDWPEVEAVYAAGIATGNATFESAPPPSWEDFYSARIHELCLVAISQPETRSPHQILGWASASKTSTRLVYRGVIEPSVYVHPDARGLGIGQALFTELIARADALGVWTIQSSVFPENAASLRLHEPHGFRVVGTRERIARMSYGPWAGAWRDTVLLERRRRDDPMFEQ